MDKGIVSKETVVLHQGWGGGGGGRKTSSEHISEILFHFSTQNNLRWPNYFINSID